MISLLTLFPFLFGNAFKCYPRYYDTSCTVDLRDSAWSKKLRTIDIPITDYINFVICYYFALLTTFVAAILNVFYDTFFALLYNVLQYIQRTKRMFETREWKS